MKETSSFSFHIISKYRQTTNPVACFEDVIYHRLVTAAKQSRDLCSGPSTDSTNKRKCVSNFPLIWRAITSLVEQLFFLTDQSWHVLKSWFAAGAQSKDFGTVSQTDQTRGLVSVCGTGYESRECTLTIAWSGLKKSSHNLKENKACFGWDFWVSTWKTRLARLQGNVDKILRGKNWIRIDFLPQFKENLRDFTGF